MVRGDIRFHSFLVALVALVASISWVGCGSPQPTDRGSTFERGSEDEYYREGIRALRGGDLEAAEGFLLQATEANPRFLAAWLSLGLLYLDMERDRAAEEAFLRATAIRERDVDAQIGLAEARLRLGNAPGAAESAARGVDLARAAHLDDMESNGLRVLAQARLELGELEAAVEALEAALEVDSTNVRARIVLARTYDALNRRPDAVRLLAAAALSTEEVPLLEEIGIALAEMGSPDRALDTLQRAHERAPERVSLTTALAAAQIEAGNRDLAIQLATQALRQSPDHVPALIVRGRAELLRGSPPRARTDAEAALQRAPGDVDALLLLGAVERQTGNSDAAERALRRAMELAPERNEPFEALLALFRSESSHAALIRLMETEGAERALRRSWQISYGHSLAAVGRSEESLQVQSPAALAGQSEASLHLDIVHRALAHPGALDPEVVVTHAQEAFASPEATGLEYRIALIDALIAANRRNEARRVVDEGLRAYPNHPGLQERARELR